MKTDASSSQPAGPGPLGPLHKAAIVVLALLALGLASPARADLDPILCVLPGDFDPPPPAPEPILHAPADTGLPRAVYEGATPPDLDPARPIIVAVHGLHAEASGWWTDTVYHGHNDFYDSAYAAGYKLFFVHLRRDDGKADTSIDNGRLLHDQLDWIASYQGVDRLNLVGHSKGGLDANVAALMGGPVDTLVTLSSPHWGSPLADLAQTSYFDWLAELLGYNDAGTKFLQTGCMELVRGIADSRRDNRYLHVYTMAATDWGPSLSALWFGGTYLATVCPGGDNDGLVCVEHAKHPFARDPLGMPAGEHRQVWDLGGQYELDHDDNRKGNQFLDFTWPWDPPDCWLTIFESIEPYLGVFHEAEASSAWPGNLRPDRPRPGAESSFHVLRGGTVDAAGSAERFPVEDGVRWLAVDLLSSGPDVEAAVIGPSGQRHRPPPSVQMRAGLFAGAWATRLHVTAPEPGSWQLLVAGREGAAYASIVTLDGDLDVGIERSPGGVARIGQPIELRVNGATGEVTTTVRTRRTSITETVDLATTAFASSGAVIFDRAGVYTLEVTVRGSTLSGNPFERSRILSIGVVDPSASRRLPEACE